MRERIEETRVSLWKGAVAKEEDRRQKRQDRTRQDKMMPGKKRQDRTGQGGERN
jgi:hypothetical protein